MGGGGPSQKYEREAERRRIERENAAQIRAEQAAKVEEQRRLRSEELEKGRIMESQDIEYRRSRRRGKRGSGGFDEFAILG